MKKNLTKSTRKTTTRDELIEKSVSYTSRQRWKRELNY